MPTPGSSGPDSTSLIRRAQGGDHAALESLFGRYYVRVLRIVRSRMGPGLKRYEDPEDIVQKSFYVAIKGFDSFTSSHDASLINWFAKIVQNQILSAAKYHGALKRDHKREASLRRINDSIASGDLQFEVAGSDTGPLERAARAEEEAILDECLNELSTEHREVIVLRDFAGGSWEWIAKKLGRPSESAARELHSRAVMALGRKASPRLPR